MSPVQLAMWAFIIIGTLSGLSVVLGIYLTEGDRDGC